MKMLDIKKEIEEKMFVGAPLSTDAMIAAYFAVTNYIQDHGEDCDVSLNVMVDTDIKDKASKKLMEELNIPNCEMESLIDEFDARKLLIDIKEN